MTVVGTGSVGFGDTEGEEIKWHEAESVLSLGAVGDGGHDGVFLLGYGIGGGFKSTDGTFHYASLGVNLCVLRSPVDRYRRSDTYP